MFTLAHTLALFKWAQPGFLRLAVLAQDKLLAQHDIQNKKSHTMCSSFRFVGPAGLEPATL